MTIPLPDPASLHLYRPEPVPVAVVTGFLGSGKTTFIRRLLTERRPSDTAVLVSEFGEIGLDHLLVEAVSETVLLLEGGCLCCAHGGDLVAALLSLLERRERREVPPYRRVILETSGLADPGPILQSFMVDPLNLGVYRLSTVVAVVDGVQGLNVLQSYPEAQRQLAIADVVFMSKQDLRSGADPALEAAIAQHARVQIWQCFAEVPDQFFQLEDSPAQRLRGNLGVAISPHGTRFASCSRHIAQDLDGALVGKWMGRLLSRADPVLRMKAVLPIAGEYRPAVLHAVGHRAERMTYLPRWPSGGRIGSMTLIGEYRQSAALEELADQLLEQQPPVPR
jgi:G3E family GTPase